MLKCCNDYCLPIFQSLAIPPTITKQPVLTENIISIEAKGSQPMRYQWLKDGKEIIDRDGCKGSTTPELVMGTGPQFKGNYMCQVKHKYGEITSSEIYYGKLHICVHTVHV